MITSRPLLMVFEEAYNAAITNDKAQSKSQIAFALFVAAISSNNIRRTSYIPKDCRINVGYENYPDTVSGPTYELLCLLNGKDSTESGRLSAASFNKLAKEVTQSFLGSSDINKDYIYNINHKVPNFDRLCDAIKQLDHKKPYAMLLRNIRKANPYNKTSENEILDGLIRSCYSDLYPRIKQYTENETNRKNGENKDKNSSFSYSLAPNNCEKMIKELNDKYKTTDKDTQAKLERILLPVYSNSPYFSICIAHKNQLPKEIRKKANENICFVFVLTFSKYAVNGNPKEPEYARSQNIFSQEHLSAYFQSNIRAMTKLMSYSTQDLDIEYYTAPFFGHDKCCADQFKTMKHKYEKMCDEWERYFIKDMNSIQWFPQFIFRSGNEKILDLLEDTRLFTPSSKTKKYKISARSDVRMNIMREENVEETNKKIMSEIKNLRSGIEKWEKNDGKT